MQGNAGYRNKGKTSMVPVLITENKIEDEIIERSRCVYRIPVFRLENI